MYSISTLELNTVAAYLKKNLIKGFIRAFLSSCAAPVLLVKKPDRGLRFCADYRGLNIITVKNCYPLPLTQETIHRLRGARVFARVDLRRAHNLIRIMGGTEWKTAFRAQYRLFEYRVIPFGLTNAQAT